MVSGSLTLTPEVVFLTSPGITALIYSQQTTLVTTLRMDKSTAHPSGLVCVDSPSHIDLFKVGDTVPVPLIGLALHEVQYTSPDHPASERRVFKFFAQNLNLRVTEYLYQYNGPTSDRPVPFSEHLLPLPRNQSQKTRGSKEAEIDAFDDFIVPDEEDVSVQHSSTDRAIEQPASLLGEALEVVLSDYIDIYEDLVQPVTREATADLTQELRDLKYNTTGSDSSKPVRLLSDIITSPLQVSDIEEVSTALQEVLLSQPGGSDLRQRLQSVQLLHTNEAPTSVLDRYNTMLTAWAVSTANDNYARPQQS